MKMALDTYKWMMMIVLETCTAFLVVKWSVGSQKSYNTTKEIKMNSSFILQAGSVER